MTLIETKMIIEDKIAPAEKSLREIDEIRSHHNAFTYIKEQVRMKREISEELIKDIHEKVLCVPELGGIYRTIAVYIKGAEHVPPNPRKVREFMKFFIDDLQKKQDLAPLERAAWVHAEFVKIHPFQDGNGKTARLLTNYSLMLDNYPPTIIQKRNIEEYFQALEIYSTTGDLTNFLELLTRNVARELDEFYDMYCYFLQ